ncbi:MAG TPA: hypothetical protein VHF88_01900 [Thermoleophilaceae bacterium]|nr:hypothetical protein [Thermoleophilaceae bacterium]
MRWERGHKETAAAGLVSLALAGLLFRPSSATAAVVAVLAIVAFVAAIDVLAKREPQRPDRLLKRLR